MQGILRAAVDAPLPLEIQGRALPGRGDSQVCKLLAKDYCLQAVHLLASTHCLLACLALAGVLACHLTQVQQEQVQNWVHRFFALVFYPASQNTILSCLCANVLRVGARIVPAENLFEPLQPQWNRANNDPVFHYLGWHC